MHTQKKNIVLYMYFAKKILYIYISCPTKTFFSYILNNSFNSLGPIPISKEEKQEREGPPLPYPKFAFLKMREKRKEI